MKVETVNVYVAYDGTRFDNENDCRAYEEKLDSYINAVEALPAALADISLFCFMTRMKSACNTCPIAELCRMRPSSFASLDAYLSYIVRTDAWDNFYFNRITEVQND